MMIRPSTSSEGCLNYTAMRATCRLGVLLQNLYIRGELGGAGDGV